ncbi:hypothetical protein [Pseudomonas migulae]
MSESSSILTELISIFPATKNYLVSAWDYAKSFANSAFTTSLAGAFAGAIAAQHIAEKGKFRDEIVKEIHKANAGTMLALAIANMALAIKKQHTKELFESYQATCADYETHKKQILAGQLDKKTPFTLECNLIALPEVTTPIEKLQEIIFDSMANAGYSISITSALIEAINSFNTAIVRRNELIKNYKSGQIPDGATVNQLYLGLEYKPGTISREYGDNIQAIHECNDDVIFFSVRLCEEIENHCHSLIKRYKKRLRGDPPKIAKTNFDKAKIGGLLPDESDYEGWTSGFSTPLTKPDDRFDWRRLLTWYRREFREVTEGDR